MSSCTPSCGTRSMRVSRRHEGAQLHRRAAEVLSEQGAPSSMIARNLLATGDPGDLSRAVDMCRAAGDDAMTRCAWEQAAHQYAAGLEALDVIGESDERRLALEIARGWAIHHSGNVDEATRILFAAA